MEGKVFRQRKHVVIPTGIWENTDLSLLERALFIEIDYVSNSESDGWCPMDFEYFSELFLVKEIEVISALDKLLKLGSLDVDTENGRMKVKWA